MESGHGLVAAALGGDPAAFATLVEGERGRVQGVVSRMLPQDEAEDVVQEAVLRAYLGLSRLRDPERFGSWLCGIAVNLAKMRLRRRAAERRLVAAGGASGQVVTVGWELLRVVQDAVELLPPGQRDVVLMHYVDDLTCEEIAALLGTSPGAVRVRLHRARAQLRRELAPLAPVPITTKKEAEMVKVTVEDVIVLVAPDDSSQVVSDQRIVLLGEEGGERLLPIWIAAPEGNSLAFPLRSDSPPRPMTSDLMVEVLRATGGGIERVTVTELREQVFYATVSLAVDGRMEELDARPSDALNLAVRVGAPIFVDEAVLEEAGLSRDGLEEKLEEDADRAGFDLPPGEWASLSAELLQALHKLPGK